MSLQSLVDLPAPAKINTFLHVVGRREDGYHLLQSAFVLVDWIDLLHVERRIDGLLRRHDLGEPLPPEDLCLRAARSLQQASGVSFGADISVLKRLPSGAGLGGGSSDAATTLVALNRLWGVGWTRGRLQALGATLGADVPFFIGGCSAFVEGIGERLRPMAWPRSWFAVVKPAAALATVDVFRHPSLRRDTEAVIVAGSLADTRGSGFAAAELVSEEWVGRFVDGFGRNDLQPPAESLCPEVAQATRWLEARFGNGRMTGSGSAVFARAGTGDQPVATLPAEELPSGWVGRMCRSLDRHPLAGWLDD